MNKFIAFVGGVVIGTVYSKQIKDIYEQYKEQVNQKRSNEITKIVENKVDSIFKAVGKDKDTGKNGGDDDSFVF